MMQQAIDRSAPTGGSFATSVVLHIAALLLLTFTVGREAAQRLVESELNEIAYIEARYGEDVAEKVKLKKPGRPGPPGPGITTDSAVRKPGPAEVAAPEPATPEPAPAQLQPRQAPAPAPRLQPQARQPERPALAAAETPAVAPAEASRRELALADQQLEARLAPTPSRQVLDDEEAARPLYAEAIALVQDREDPPQGLDAARRALKRLQSEHGDF